MTRRIEAAPDLIWSLLTDAASYAEWNPAVIAIDGEIEEGHTIKLTSIVDPSREFKLKVSDVDPPRHMVWSSGMPGIFQGVRSYDLVLMGEGLTEFRMEEVYSGLMAPLITKSIPDMTDSFEKFADGLKATAESR